jgi:hypothetical protein
MVPPTMTANVKPLPSMRFGWCCLSLVVISAMFRIVALFQHVYHAHINKVWRPCMASMAANLTRDEKQIHWPWQYIDFEGMQR